MKNAGFAGCVLVAVIASARVAGAQEVPSVPAPVVETAVETPSLAPARMPAELKIPIAAWAASAAADQITTYRFLTDYRGLLHEQNPLVNRLEGHPAMMAAAGGAIDAMSGWAAWRLLGRRHPRLAAAVFVGAAAYRAYLVGWNLSEMRGARASAAGHPAALR